MIEKSEFDPKQIKKLHATYNEDEANAFLETGWIIIEVCKIHEIPDDSYCVKYSLAWLKDETPKIPSRYDYSQYRTKPIVIRASDDTP